MKSKKLQQSIFTPVRVLGGSFLGLIIIGTMFLMLPQSQAEGVDTGVLDALFTATSAVCVTGLVVVDTATAWTRFGQVVILLLIQFGGIGIISFGALFAIMLGHKITFQQRQIIKEQFGQTAIVNVLTIAPIVAGSTLIIELLGAALLLPVFTPKYGISEGIWHSIFHSVAAFCNAGFSTISNNLVDYAGNPLLNLVICALIVLGGLGFPVIGELISRKDKRKRLSLHSRVVLWTTANLIIFGAIILYMIEGGFDPAFRALPFQSRVLASLFQSVTARTAGFNTVDIGALAPASIFVIQLLMFIGGSPSGTAGGIKTTTFAACIATVRAVFTGHSDVRLFDRRLEMGTARRSLVLFAGASLLITIAILFMLFAEDPGQKKDFLSIGFEVFSAFGTVGLSTGITSHLTAGQKIVIILMMFIGRLGPMTFALALSSRPQADQVRYPETDLLTG
ncbi:MAG: TrkH family potassium uptake protein [bacterium]|nr:TrkH family potassium uptake protein [bacterium]